MLLTVIKTNENEIRYGFYFFPLIYSALVKCVYDEKVCVVLYIYGKREL